MSPRPPMSVGAYGTIWVSDGGAPYKARARYRDQDGAVRTVARFGQTKAAAKRALAAALADRQETTQGIGRSTRIADLALAWLADIETSDRAAGTKRLYRFAVDSYVIPALGQVRVGEASTAVCDAVLRAVVAEHGKGSAKTTRAVLNGVFGLAVRLGAATVNPVRETSAIPRRSNPARALTIAETEDLTDQIRSHPRAAELDLPDLVDFMLATGVRIGEALAIRQTAIDLDAGTVEINATVIRIPGKGLVIQERPKTAAGWRVLALPSFAVAMLERRAGELRPHSPEGTVFPSPSAWTLRDPSNCAGNLRAVRAELGYPWVTFKTFRKTVATRMDEAGCSAREIADQLGHSKPSMTQDVYMGRKVVSAAAAKVLDR